MDDVIDILQEEATEDIYALGGVQSDGDHYTVTGTIIKSQVGLLQKRAIDFSIARFVLGL